MTATDDLIAARRQYIRDSAKCEGCGSTVTFCNEQRANNQDPTAPEWFGCCAIGIPPGPCHHRQDPAALQQLLDEIASGTVRTVEEVIPKPRKRGPDDIAWNDYLDQGERWKPNGKPMVRVADMDPEWRLNASKWLVRNAARFAAEYSRAESIAVAVTCGGPLGPSDDTRDAIEYDTEIAAAKRADDPHGWIRTTALYRALVAGLPSKPKKLDKLAARARHWSDCPARTDGGDCRCDEIKAQHEYEREVALGIPEWTTS